MSRFSHPFPRPVYIPYRPCSIAVAVSPVSSRPVGSERIEHLLYSVLITPISTPQCPHFTIKSGYRPFLGVINCVFVPDTATMIRRPHTGQQTGRSVFFSPLVCSSFFLRITNTPLSNLPLPGVGEYRFLL